MDSLTLDAETSIRPLEAGDTDAVFDLINRSRSHLDRWLRWSSALRTREDVAAFIQHFIERREAGKGFHCGIWHRDQLAGGIVCWHIERRHRFSEIGYWLGAEFLGHGLATRASARMITHLFKHENMHRIEMQCAVDNDRSRAVPERLGFKLEGIRRSAYWIVDRFCDHAVYGLLAFEWKEPPAVARPK
jgi:ribosomal-protein-serine acetyltransferase